MRHRAGRDTVHEGSAGGVALTGYSHGDTNWCVRLCPAKSRCALPAPVKLNSRARENRLQTSSPELGGCQPRAPLTLKLQLTQRASPTARCAQSLLHSPVAGGVAAPALTLHYADEDNPRTTHPRARAAAVRERECCNARYVKPRSDRNNMQPAGLP